MEDSVVSGQGGLADVVLLISAILALLGGVFMAQARSAQARSWGPALVAWAVAGVAFALLLW